MKVLPLVVVLIVAVAIGTVIVTSRPKTTPSSTNYFSNSSNTRADRVEPDGTIIKPDGTMVKPDGTMIKPDGTMIGPDGKVITENNNTNSGNSNTNQVSKIPSTTKTAAYIEYTPSTLASAQTSGGQTILYFHADWCPTCRALDPSISNNINNLPAGLTILKVNYDRENDLKRKYGVTYQHTFVQVDSQGNKLKLWSGTTDATDIKDQLI